MITRKTTLGNVHKTFPPLPQEGSLICADVFFIWIGFYPALVNHLVTWPGIIPNPFCRVSGPGRILLHQVHSVKSHFKSLECCWVLFNNSPTASAQTPSFSAGIVLHIMPIGIGCLTVLCSTENLPCVYQALKMCPVFTSVQKMQQGVCSSQLGSTTSSFHGWKY